MDAGYLDRQELKFQRDHVVSIGEMASHDAGVVFEKVTHDYPALYREHPFSDPQQLKTKLSTMLEETVADVGTIAEWHPGVAQSPVITPQASGLGAARRVELYDGSTAVETVTSLEEGRSVTVLMSDHTMPLSHGAAAFEVEKPEAA